MESKTQFKADVATLKQRGTKVVISSEEPMPHRAQDRRQKQQFVTSMKAIIDEYGFNGLDVDLEGTSVILDSGDTDFKNPKTPKIVNLISALREIADAYGSSFILTAAPETQYVQGGYGNYGGGLRRVSPDPPRPARQAHVCPRAVLQHRFAVCLHRGE